MGISRRHVLSGMAAAAAGAVVRPSLGAAAEEFYRGKTLTLLVSAPAGSLTDFVVRQFAPHYAEHVPGRPEVVVMNMAGAGGMVAAASLQSRQPKDGTVIGFLQRNNLYMPLLEPGRSSFDPREVQWLGSLNKVYYCLVAMTRSGVSTADDLFKKRLIIGATGFANENRTLPELVNDYLGAKMKIVPGYSGRGEVYLAMERGEVDGWASTIDGLTQGEPARMLKDGKMKVVLNLGWDSPAPFTDVPNLSAYVKDPKLKSLFDFFLLPFQAGRPFAVPKEVPKDRVDTLQAAFEATVKDKKFRAAMAAKNYSLEPINGAAVTDIVTKLYATPKAQVAEARKIVKP